MVKYTYTYGCGFFFVNKYIHLKDRKRLHRKSVPPVNKGQQIHTKSEKDTCMLFGQETAVYDLLKEAQFYFNN